MKFGTIRQTARELKPMGINETILRRMVRAGTCPGFYTGNTYMVNVDKLLERLNEMEGEDCTNG